MLLDVEYMSQLGDGANRAIHDCGPACLAMLINHIRDTHLTVDGVCEVMGISGRDLGAAIWFLSGTAKTYGVRVLHMTGLYPYKIEEMLNIALQPAIALVRYQALPNRYDASYTGGHYVLIVGVTENDVVIHDPYWPDARGANQRVPRGTFEQAWTADGVGFKVSGQALVVVS